MSKNILLTLKNNNDILISVNGENKLTISESNRTLNASSIYELLDYHYGDTYEVSIMNEKHSDDKVVCILKELLEEITKALELIQIEQKDSDLNEVQELLSSNKEKVNDNSEDILVAS